ncbi:MAG TPA: hypothetical protein VK530_17675 [Candidatus Acidoferrum sp.]|nr:hypothetical protein [Candidatus Acidoferrum sp.]
MQTIKMINEWGFQIMFLVLWCASSVWTIAGAVLAVQWALPKLSKAEKKDA